MTVALVLGYVALLFLYGAGPTLLLLRKETGLNRVLLMPFAGFSASILLFFAMAPLNWTGRHTALALTAVLAGAAAAGFRASRPARREFAEAVPALAVGAGGCAITCWPLFRTGYQHFVGYANPDVPWFIVRLNYFFSHPFGNAHAVSEAYRDLDPGSLLGAFAHADAIAALFGVPISCVFSTLCAGAVMLAGASVWLLCSSGLGMGKRASLLVTAGSCSSSLLALAFELQSLGTLGVVVLLPVSLALMLVYLRKPAGGVAIVLALLVAGSLYNYPQGAGILAVALAGAAAGGCLSRPVPVRPLALLSVIGIALAALPLPRYVPSLVGVSRWAAEASHLTAFNEIQLTYALVITERGIPFLWGLWVPFGPLPAWMGPPGVALALLVAFGALIASGCVAGFAQRRNPLPLPFRLAVAAAAAICAFYYLRGVGYGVFKIASWLALLLAVVVGSVVREMTGRCGVLRGAGLAAFAVYTGLNLAQNVQLGNFAFATDTVPLHNAPGLRLSDLTRLETLPNGSGKVLVASPDVVYRRWAKPFLGTPDPRAGFADFVDERFAYSTGIRHGPPQSEPRRFPGACAPEIRANSYDILDCADASSPWLLDWSGERDITGRKRDPVWASGPYALERMPVPDLLTVGYGWYRAERNPASAIPWQRRPFRWLRQRGEVLAILPAPGAKRLHLVVAAGYGLPSDERTIDVVVNGGVRETLRIRGYANLCTRPFQLAPPLSQIELAIHETVEPLPRRFALWNRWVPADARRLNVAVSRFDLVPESFETANLKTSAVFDPSEEWETPTNGIFPDCWLGTAAEIHLRAGAGSSTLVLRGWAPGSPALAFPAPVEVLAGDVPIARRSLEQGGDFEWRLSVPESVKREWAADGRARIVLRPLASFNPSKQGISGDTRTLSFRLRFVALE